MSAEPLWTAGEAARATKGAGNKDWRASGVAIDSRAVAPGDLFIAIRGPRVDGHDFVADALKRGAAAAMVERVPAGLAKDAPLLMVENTDKGLRALGAAARARGSAKIIGVTGSVGKTGVKEALRTALSAQGVTAATIGNLNNHWGLPLSLARMDRAARFGVFEMGMNHPGELTALSGLARPHVAVVTNVERVHAQHFASVQAIADAKAEIFAGVEPDGAAVLNRDNPHFERLAKAARGRGIGRIVSFGARAGAQVRALAVDPGPVGTRIRADVCGRVVEYMVGIPGGHWVPNSLCVLAAVWAVDGDVESAAWSLAGLRPMKGRGLRTTVALPGGIMPGGTFDLMDDSYNASPVSMANAIETLAATAVGRGGRRIAVLGDMLELGPDTAELHAALVNPLEAGGIDLVFTAGRAMSHLRDALPASMRGGHAVDSERLALIVAASVRPGDVVLVKGSAGSRMGRVVEVLQELGAAARKVANGA